MWSRIALAFAFVLSAAAFGQVGRSAAILDAPDAFGALVCDVRSFVARPAWTGTGVSTPA